MTIVGQVITQFQQNNSIVKSGKTKLMSGELDLTGLTGAGTSLSCYVGKRKRTFSQQMEGNVNSFEAYCMAEIGTNIESFDIILTERGERFIVGPVSIRNDNTTINSNLNDAGYLYADLELYSE